ncbi:unnamed protein product [Rangifer tarandus platyrhynchus]|uniref:Uncharacterized protein n=2 Tax=Rangifer tarandus platyrhynchus TaxID=3082113 RepID=A0ACB0F135_RANTA|nr:unnamed protein product [Rangifer tarandus platyrhynchus]CAI9706597.1 unnamed protein product [Rangifer tarandus platyrhynchus]
MQVSKSINVELCPQAPDDGTSMKDEAQPCLKSFCGIPTELSCSSETAVTVGRGAAAAVGPPPPRNPGDWRDRNSRDLQLGAGPLQPQRNLEGPARRGRGLRQPVRGLFGRRPHSLGCPAPTGRVPAAASGARPGLRAAEVAAGATK